MTTTLKKKKKDGQKIHRFKPDEIDPNTGKKRHDLINKVIVVLGPRNSGKSFLIKDIMTLINNIPICKIVNGTEEMTGHYGSFVPSICISDEYSDEIIRNFVKRQRNIRKKQKSDEQYKNTDIRNLLLLDDLAYDKSWTKQKATRFIFMNGRHAGITFIMASQEPMGMPPELRSNIDYVFICNQNNYKDRDKIYDNYVSGFKNKKEFNRILDKCTENYKVVVINKTARSNKMEDIVFWYKAREHHNFRFGCRELWMYQAQKYDPYYEEKKRQLEREREQEEARRKEYKKKKEEDHIYGGDNLEIDLVP